MSAAERSLAGATAAAGMGVGARVPAGLAALAVAWVVALVLYFALAEVEAPRGSGVTTRDGPVRGVDLGAALVLIGAWQVLFYVVWRGWPFSAIARRSV